MLTLAVHGLCVPHGHPTGRHSHGMAVVGHGRARPSLEGRGSREPFVEPPEGSVRYGVPTAPVGVSYAHTDCARAVCTAWPPHGSAFTWDGRGRSRSRTT